MKVNQNEYSQAHAILDDLSNGLGYLGADNTRQSWGGAVGKALHDLGVKAKGETHIQAFKEGKVQDFTALIKKTKQDLKEGKISPQEAVEDAKEALKLLYQDLKTYRHHDKGAHHSQHEEYLGSSTNGSSARFTTYQHYNVTPVTTPKAPGSLEKTIKNRLESLGETLDIKEDLTPVRGATVQINKSS